MASTIDSPCQSRAVVSTAAATCPAIMRASGEAVSRTGPKDAASMWCWWPATARMPVGAPSSWKTTWNAVWPTATVSATRDRDARAPIRAAAAGIRRAVTASTSSGCGAAPPAIVCDAAASTVATVDAAAARRSRSCRMVTLPA
ncbi:hypothetical protein A4X16_00955 [Microbacterium sp. H83]|nr:hypothetical protein A4X16_00955 [Microbacterium sp. H83]